MDTALTLQLQSLSDEQRQYVLLRFGSEKQASIAYILWFCLGVHYFYVNKPFLNIIYWLTGAGLGIWGFIDLFRIPGIVRRYNNERLTELIAEAKQLHP